MFIRVITSEILRTPVLSLDSLFQKLCTLFKKRSLHALNRNDKTEENISQEKVYDYLLEIAQFLIV